MIKLQTDHRKDPLGLDDRHPHFSWIMQGSRRGEKQTGYRVGVATSQEKLAADDFDMWDSGYVASADMQVCYGAVGSASLLQAKTAYYWTVFVWDKDGVMHRSQEVAVFETALFGDFGAHNQWIIAPDNQEEPTEQTAAPLYRKQFTLIGAKADVAKARLYSTAAGNQIMYMNGKRVSDDYFAPGKSKYTAMLYYQTYDVTPLLLDGDNTVGAEVGQGWYNAGAVGSNYGTQAALKAKLIVTYQDGTEQVIDTDDSWLGTRHAATLSNRFYNGQVVDGRQAIEGWCENDNHSPKWMSVEAVTTFNTSIYGPIANVFVAENMGPVKCLMTKTPVSVEKKGDTDFLYTFDQNVVGTLRLTATAPADTTVTVKYCEFLTDGTITGGEYMGHNGKDTYIFRGDKGGETVTFELVYHGFQYVLISGLAQAPALECVEALVLTSEMEETGELVTSNDKISRYVENVRWSLRGNFISTLTDCPTREKNTWTGDAQIFAATASYLANIFNHYRNFQVMTQHSCLGDGGLPEIVPEATAVNAASSENRFTSMPAGWADSAVIISWELYHQFGDVAFITDNYDTMKGFVDCLVRQRVYPNGKEPPYFIVDPTDLRLDGGKYGDWLFYGDGLNNPAYYEKTYYATEYTCRPMSFVEIGTAYLAYSCGLLSKMAAVIGKTEDAAYYSSLRERFAKAWRKNFVAADGYTCTSNGISTLNETTGEYEYTPGEGWITSYALGIYFDLFETEELKRKAAKNLATLMKKANYKQIVGFLGANTLYPALSWNGQFDTAMRIMENEEMPSLLYMINSGATTIWETYQNNNYSRNHYVFGAPCRWLFTDVLGISHQYDTNNAGYTHFVLQPHYASYESATITWVKGSYTARTGVIKSEWKLSSDRKTFTYKCTVPANTSATLSLPVETANAKITEGGKDATKAEGVKFIEIKDGRTYYEIASGTYEFVVENK